MNGYFAEKPGIIQYHILQKSMPFAVYTKATKDLPSVLFEQLNTKQNATKHEMHMVKNTPFARWLKPKSELVDREEFWNHFLMTSGYALDKKGDTMVIAELFGLWCMLTKPKTVTMAPGFNFTNNKLKYFFELDTIDVKELKKFDEFFDAVKDVIKIAQPNVVESKSVLTDLFYTCLLVMKLGVGSSYYNIIDHGEFWIWFKDSHEKRRKEGRYHLDADGNKIKDLDDSTKYMEIKHCFNDKLKDNNIPNFEARKKKIKRDLNNGMNFLVGNNIIRIRGSRSSSATLSEVAVEKDYKDDLGRPIKKRDVHTKTNTTIEINEKIPVVGGGTRADEENRGILEAGDNKDYYQKVQKQKLASQR